jgi:hypothetical protein
VTKPPKKLVAPKTTFARIVDDFARERRITRGGKGFGSNALEVDGRIFAMLSSHGELVLKLPATRVSELVREARGVHFTAGRKRPMREWLVVTSGSPTSAVELAREACRYVVDCPRRPRR